MRTRHHRDSSWRITPLGRVLAVAFVVLVILALVAPSSGVYLGLTLVVAFWAWTLTSIFPTGRGRGMSPGEAGRLDYGREAAREYERTHGRRS